jgi:hypothetical protein
LRSCTSPQFGSCLENFVIRPKVSGQTLRNRTRRSDVGRGSSVVISLGLDCRFCSGERKHRTAQQEPNHARGVITRQPPEGRSRSLRDGVQTEQFASRPAEQTGLCTQTARKVSASLIACSQRSGSTSSGHLNACAVQFSRLSLRLYQV